MKIARRAVAAAVLLCVLLAGCAREDMAEEAAPSAAAAVAKIAQPGIGGSGLRDDPVLYAAYDPTDVVCFYITVLYGSAADGTYHTFEEVNAYRYVEEMPEEGKVLANAIFQVGDESGPLPGEVGYWATGPNATINARGRSSTEAAQKSYRISLFDSAGLWRGQRAIALNKHPYDPTRLRNMLYFELLQDVPGMVSLRTQFVHVYIRDATDPEAPEGFADYGLFTQVELPNGRYLRNHGLSRNGDLYKANFCEMFRYPDNLKPADDPDYDAAKFAEILEPKSDGDHRKLLRMLDAVNDFSIPIEEVVARHFDLDNLTSYLAFNLLMGNPDSSSQNYFLYSPVNSETWYYICWDGDGSLSYGESELLGRDWTEDEWRLGISNYWGVALFNRLLRVKAYRDALDEKVEALRSVVSPERIEALVSRYREVVDEYAHRMPDEIGLEVSFEDLEAIYETLPGDADRAYQFYRESLLEPMPFYMSEVYAGEEGLELYWDAAYDFDGELVRYDVQVARDWTFDEGGIVWQSLGQSLASAALPRPEPGEYYWRVVAENKSGRRQGAFDVVWSASGGHAGMRRFVVRPDGTVVNDS